MSEAAAQGRSIDDVMLAMDVVDTLRHRQLMVERELDAGEREEHLLQRLKAIYAAQGIDVPDHVLAEGVAALREDRFRYTAPAPGFKVSMAKLYVKRGRWMPPLLIGLAVTAVLLLGYGLLVSGPAQRERAAIPTELARVRDAVAETASSEQGPERARQLYDLGMSAIASDDLDKARSTLADLRSLRVRQDAVYELNIVSRPGERSGFFRIPDVNSGARNYYLVVEAVGPQGDVLEQSIRNEEDGKTYTVKKWGLRVSKSAYDKVAADKKDDGIVQNRRVAEKRRGELEPVYVIPSTGAAVTKW